MSQRGKFSSLTLINWNGFFARTFELDELVTTLSGGNGAGKSTTMAAFVTALIPDLTLLHFRNTTEAGATGGSKDKGLHGKLRAGTCYALLEVHNSLNERIICGVRLQQIAGRDKKVDLKPFVIEQCDKNQTPIEFVTEKLSDRSVRILSLDELKQHFEESNSMQLKLFNAITDYHAMMFDLGILPKKLRSASDRSKYYRLIEASLYGGISSAITRSLRDYLLPENIGVKKAFQDMELALRENRMTLEAIQLTQADRDLFKHLIAQTTDYVAADYVRHQNERRTQIEQLLTLRSNYFRDQKITEQKQKQQILLGEELFKIETQSPDLEAQNEQLTEQLHLVQNAAKQYEKIESYKEETAILEDKVIEQTDQVEIAHQQYLESKEQVDLIESELDSLTLQLSDYEQALDKQQTQTVQYQQAMQKLEEVRRALNDPNLNVDKALDLIPTYQSQLQGLTEQWLQAQQHLNIEQSQQAQFDTAYHLVDKILKIKQSLNLALPEALTSQNAWQKAKQIAQDASQQKHQVQQLPALKKSLLQQKMQQTQKTQLMALAETLDEALKASEGVSILTAEKHLDFTALWQVQSQFEMQQETLLEIQFMAQEERIIAKQSQKQSEQRLESLKHSLPHWSKVQQERLLLEESYGKTFSSTEEVTQALEDLIAKERLLNQERDKLTKQKSQLEKQIKALHEPNGTDDPRLTEIAQKLNGVLLAEIYSDVSVQDAPYFSALYGPARNAIVVQDFNSIKETLMQEEDYPDDLYLIEGDPNAFDMSLFESEEGAEFVLVKNGDKQWRLSQFPKISLFGKAARLEQLEKLEQERIKLNDSFSVLSFDLQKAERLRQKLSSFVANSLHLALSENPEEAIKKLQAEQVNHAKQESDLESKAQETQFKLSQIETHLAQMNQLTAQSSLLQEADLFAELEQLECQITETEQLERYLAQSQNALDQLLPIVDALQFDPKEREIIAARYDELTQQREQITQIQFMLQEIKQRQAHFSYAYQIEPITDAAHYRDELLHKRAQISETKTQLKSQLEQNQAAYHQANQLLTSLRAQFEMKTELVASLIAEYQQFKDLDDKPIAFTLERIETQRQAIQQRLFELREMQIQIERQLTQCEGERIQLEKSTKQLIEHYRKSRKQALQAKESLQKALVLVKENALEKMLNRGELRYLDSDALRSISDKALGALRIAVDDNEQLRDLLRYSEDAKYAERKIQFYIAVSQHLRERIRQDILKTDDPILAIEQMEVELLRLKEELTARESQLVISSKGVANLIKKSIQREEQRIMQLNHGLQTVDFGQVHGVRLKVNLIESHALLLNALSHPTEREEDLFSQSNLTFSQALAKLYQRLNPHLELRSNAQTVGELLLDYRNYLSLEIEVNRGAEGWLKAESGALSTGEAIGTGMSILLMVIQSWEEESKRLRNKEIAPCRLLFLDEAARLDGKSIATLFELCDKLSMQLIIAAPENISPEKGTTYKLMRKVINGQEMVQVVGLRGFGS